LSALLADAPSRHGALAREAGVPHLIEQRGLLYVYPERTAFESEALAWRLRRDNGVRWIELAGDELYQREPALDRCYRFGALVEAGAHCVDPGEYVAALVRHAQSLGAPLCRARATGFDIRDGKLAAVLIDQGAITCDRAVIAAGIRSRELAKAAGDRVNLESERGYHVVITDPEVAPKTPVMPSDGKMANTLTAGGLRASGQVELASVDAPPNWERAAVLLKHLRRTYPALQRDIAADRVKYWMGHRPSTPDGLPGIGPASATSDIIHAFGHGHVGLASAPMTARLVAEIIGERTPSIPIFAYSASRF
jgi:D-amino-acid dehydrogenase